jgi:two-component system OmpR family response regulator
MRVLLLEDDDETAVALEKGLVHEGYAVRTSRDVEEALVLIEDESFDFAVLDVMVPGGSGYDVLARLKADKPQIQVLMLTARGAVEDRVQGLDRGADDYLVKPFAFGELAARLRAMKRRHTPHPNQLRFGELRMDLIRRQVSVEERPLDLTPIEFSLLASLLRANGEPVGRQELLRNVWGYEFDPGTNVIDVHVNRLRRKLEDAGVPELIRTVRGRGYATG